MSNLRKNLQRKRRIARRRKAREPLYDRSERLDPIEFDPAYKSIFRLVNMEAAHQTKFYKGQMGYCHLFWGTKQDILRRKYGIEWKTPAQMNPDTLYD